MSDVRSEIEQILAGLYSYGLEMGERGDHSYKYTKADDEYTVEEATQAILALIDRVRIDEAEWWNEGFGDGMQYAQDRIKALKATNERKEGK